MKKKIFLMVAASAMLVGATSCKDYLHEGKPDPDVVVPGSGEEEEFEYPASYTFNHPCGLVSQADIDHVKSRVAAADPNDPVYASWQRFITNTYTRADYDANPVETLVRGNPSGTGTTENYIVADRDAAAALQLAIRYQVSGDEAYAEKSVAIMNEWADVCKRITANDNNQYLLAGFQGYQFASAAELMRDYDGWAAQDFADFKQWIMDVWYAKNYWFIENHGGSGVCDLHYWSNWELANLASILAIGILMEDVQIVNYAYFQFREGAGSGCIDNMIPYDPVVDPEGLGLMMAQNMESGRDQGHSTLVISMCAELCKMASHIGIDFFGMDDNKVLAMAEYTAKYNCRPGGNYIATEGSMPAFIPYDYCIDCICTGNHGAHHTAISSAQRGTMRPCWDMLLAHYKSKGLDPRAYYYTQKFAEQLRYSGGQLTGDGGAGDSRYGNTSGAFDQVGWGTMLFYRD